MPDKRRSTAPGARGPRPAGRRGPGRAGPGPAGRPGRPARGARPGATTRRPAAGTSSRTRPRFTGRAAVLVLVLAVLAVSYASSLRAYLQQRSHIDELQTTIAERQAEIADLEREKERWEDPEFVRAQARERLGYVMPGETPFVVLDDGVPLQPEGELHDPSVEPETPRAWYEDAWDSVVLAGRPPRRADPPPATLIGKPGKGGAEDEQGSE